MSNKIAEKLTKEGLITPKSETNGNDQNQGNQSGSGSDNGGEGTGDDNGGQSSTQQGNNDSGQGGNAGDQQGADAGAEASGGGGSAPGESELDDKAIIQLLNKRGIKVGSLSEITLPGDRQLTEAEQQEAAQQRMNSVRAYGLQNQIVTSTDFDDYARESNMPVNDLALSLYKQERIAEEKQAQTPADQMPTDEQLEEEFNDVYFRHAKDTDPKRKHADKLLQKKVDEHLQGKYATIYGLEDQYEAHQTSAQQRQQYDQTVDAVVAKAGTEVTFSFLGEDQKTTLSYPVKVTPQQIAAAKQAMLSDKTFQILAASGEMTPEAVNATFTNILNEQNKNVFLSQVVHAHTSQAVAAIKKGRREIFSSSEANGENESNKPVNERIKAQLNKPESKKILNKTP